MAEAADPGPEVPRRRFNWDMLAALMAVFVGVCALGVSLYTARLQRQQVEAQAWPYLQLWRSDAERRFNLSNRGIGPAQVRDLRVFVDGAEVESWGDAFARLAGRPLQCSRLSFISRRVLAANEDVAMLEFCNDADFAAFDAGIARVQREFCYCSVLGDCWLLSERAATEDEYLRAVDRCPVGAPGRFR
jgi:hypothetical protein